MVVPLSSDNLSSQLSPVLGQYGIQVSEFLAKLEESSCYLNTDLVLRVFVDIFVNSSFSLHIGSLAFKDFIKGEVFPIGRLSLYRAFLLYSFVSKTVPDSQALYQNLQGYLNSFN